MPDSFEKAVTSTFTATTGSTGTESIYEVREGERFELEKVRIYSNASTTDTITLQVASGATNVAPHDGAVSVFVGSVEMHSGHVFDTGDVIAVEWDASGTTADVEVTIVLEGEWSP